MSQADQFGVHADRGGLPSTGPRRGDWTSDYQDYNQSTDPAYHRYGREGSLEKDPHAAREAANNQEQSSYHDSNGRKHSGNRAEDGREQYDAVGREDPRGQGGRRDAPDRRGTEVRDRGRGPPVDYGYSDHRYDGGPRGRGGGGRSRYPEDDRYYYESDRGPRGLERRGEYGPRDRRREYPERRLRKQDYFEREAWHRAHRRYDDDYPGERGRHSGDLDRDTPLGHNENVPGRIGRRNYPEAVREPPMGRPALSFPDAADMLNALRSGGKGENDGSTPPSYLVKNDGVPAGNGLSDRNGSQLSIDPKNGREDRGEREQYLLNRGYHPRDGTKEGHSDYNREQGGRRDAPDRRGTEVRDRGRGPPVDYGYSDHRYDGGPRDRGGGGRSRYPEDDRYYYESDRGPRGLERRGEYGPRDRRREYPERYWTREGCSECEAWYRARRRYDDDYPGERGIGGRHIGEPRELRDRQRYEYRSGAEHAKRGYDRRFEDGRSYVGDIDGYEDAAKYQKTFGYQEEMRGSGSRPRPIAIDGDEEDASMPEMVLTPSFSKATDLLTSLRRARTDSDPPAPALSRETSQNSAIMHAPLTRAVSYRTDPPRQEATGDLPVDPASNAALTDLQMGVRNVSISERSQAAEFNDQASITSRTKRSPDPIRKSSRVSVVPISSDADASEVDENLDTERELSQSIDLLSLPDSNSRNQTLPPLI